MLKEIIEFMAGVKMTIVSAAFLFISLGFMIAGKQPAFDPIWLTIVISGVPIVYRAFYKLIYVHAISSPLLITTAMAAAIAMFTPASRAALPLTTPTEEPSTS